MADISDVLVDDEDRHLLSDRKWHKAPHGYCLSYLKILPDGHQIYVSLHRMILEKVLGRVLTSKEQVDHINRNPLDNRRQNLRLATPSQNSQNVNARSNSRSGVRGAHWDCFRKKFVARVRHKGKRYYCGIFTDPVEAGKSSEKKRNELGFFSNRAF